MGISRNPLKLTGRFDFLLFYPLGNKIIFRMVSPHTRKRILKDPCFKKFRECSAIMAKASRIGSVVYKALPKDFRQYWMYRAFVGEAMKLLKDKGTKMEDVLEILWKTYVEIWEIKRREETVKSTNTTSKQQKPQKTKPRQIKINISWKQNEKLPVSYVHNFPPIKNSTHEKLFDMIPP